MLLGQQLSIQGRLVFVIPGKGAILPLALSKRKALERLVVAAALPPLGVEGEHQEDLQRTNRH